MARRSEGDSKPFRPVESSLLRAVMQHVPEQAGPIVEALPPAEPVPRETPRKSEGAPNVIPIIQRLDQEKRVLYTRAEREALDQFVQNLANRLQTPLKASHVLRALTALLFYAESFADQRATRHGALVRPPNGDVAALQRFERDLARILGEAIRDSGPLR